jgi:hypothetical protein
MVEKQNAALAAKTIPGSPEDIQLTFRILQRFFAEKVKAAELFQNTGRVAEGTQGTKSVCHIDGTDDPDDIVVA